MAISERGDRLFAFGGFGSGTFPGRLDAGTHLADSWSLRLAGGGAGWRNVTPPSGEANPLHREAAAVATDTRRERLVMVGGLEGDDELADVWAADLGPGPAAWEQLCSPTSCGAGPTARWGGQAVYDPVGGRIIVFGGRRTDGTTFADAWALSLDARPRWTRLEAAGEAPAAPRPRHPRAGDRRVRRTNEARDRLLVAFGRDAERFYADTWSFSMSDENWHALAPIGSAP